jgi:cell division protein FtsW
MDMNKKIGRPADCIAMVVLLLMAVGTVFVFSAGANLRQGLNLQHFYEFGRLRPLLFFPLASLLMYAVSRINYRRFSLDKHWSKSPLVYSLVFSIALLIFVLLPQFGTEINFARRWLRIPLGPATLSFQPSELAKWSLLFFLAAYCDKFNTRLKLYWKGFVPICLIIGLVAGLIIIEDFGTAAFLAFLCGLILIIAGVNFWHILTLVPFGAAGLIGAIISSPARLRRIEAFINPEKWAGSANYQANQSLIALGSGGLFGKGLGMGISKYGHLPEDTTDFIFAIIGEELGFLGTAAVIGLFIIFIWLGIVVIYRCRDRFGRFLAAGIVLAIGFQAAINIGVATVVLPTKGIPLPFISSGGTSMLLSAAAVGVLLNIARDTENTELENGGQ